MSRCMKYNIVLGTPELTAYSQNISSLVETLKLFITDDILNEMCHHTKCREQFPNSKNVERYQFRRALCFPGFVHCFWHSEDKRRNQ